MPATGDLVRPRSLILCHRFYRLMDIGIDLYIHSCIDGEPGI